MLKLTLQLVGKEPQVFRFTGRTDLTLGRKSTNSVSIPDSRVSGAHGEIVWDESGAIYRDLKSTNGSLVIRASERIILDGKVTFETRLMDGDLLLLGDVDDPVVLALSLIDESDPDVASEGTVVANRRVENSAELSRILIHSPARGADLDQLLGLLRTLGQHRELDQAFNDVGAFLLTTLPAAHSVCLVVDGEDTWTLGRNESSASRVPPKDAVYPRGLVADAIQKCHATLLQGSGQLVEDKSLARLNSTSAMAIPLGTSGKPFGVLVILGGLAGFSESDLDLSAALAFQVQSCFETANLFRRLRAVERRLRDENRYLRRQVHPEGGQQLSGIIGESPAINAVFEQVRVVTNAAVTVLVTGETGTGKELFARAIHDTSDRASRLFAAVNCAALSENLLESELFGHVKGAFTGAHDSKKGLFQVADGGTLFLDEIGELSLKLQAKLLRVLQEGEVMLVGSTRPIKVDVRIVCATHRNLRTEVSEGRFREDLFYRINVFPIHIPPLRERSTDVGILAEYFVTKYASKFGRDVTGLTHGAITVLQKYAFPGNIRELENEIQRAVLLTPAGNPVDVNDLSRHVTSGHRAADGASAGPVVSGGVRGTLKETMEVLERQVLLDSLEEHGWNRSATARSLGISRQALMVKLSKYSLSPD